MTSWSIGPQAYPFIDVAVLDAVRKRFAAGDALLLLAPDLESVLWANAPGAGLIGAHDLIEAVGMDSGLSPTAHRQIAGAAGFAQTGKTSQLVVRLGGRPVPLAVERIVLPGGEEGILMSASAHNGEAAASRAISGFAASGQYLAMIDHEATVQAATEGFEYLGFDRQTLAELVAQVRTERDRLVKRRLRAGNRLLPVGFARLTDDPALHLLVTVDDGNEVDAEQPAAEKRKDNSVVATTVVEPSQQVETANEAAPPPVGRSIRFLWRTDDQGRLSAVSDEFLDAAGLKPEDLTGRTFTQLAGELGIDRDGAIAALLERRDTWSGKTIIWPIGDRGVPVDLAALPAYNRERAFEGFRGFGVARFGDAQALPNKPAETTTPVEPVIEVEPARPEPPALQSGIQPEVSDSDKVIRLSERRGAPERALSQSERSAFREIGDRLRADEDTTPQPFGKRTVEPAPDLPSDGVAEKDKVETAGPAPDNDDALPALQDVSAELPFEETFSEADDVVFAEPTEVDEAEIAELESLDAEADDEPEAQPQPVDTSVIDRLPVPVLIHAGDELHYANPEFLELTGYPSLDHLVEAGGIDALFVDPMDDEEDVGEQHLRLRRKDGVEFPIDGLLRSVKWGGRSALMLVVREANTDADSEDGPALAEARARIAEMRTILDTATDGVIMIDAEGSIRSISRPAEALFGFDSEDLSGKPFTSLFAIESQGIARDYLNGLSERGVASLLNDGREVIGREAQGRFIPLFMTIGKMPNDTGYCAVLRDVTHWKRAEEELSQSRRQAERASSQKTDFLARVSHEIRTPLNAIIGFSELMLDEKFGPVNNDRYRDYLRDINRSGSHVLDLVNDLLDITKIEAGEQEMAYEAVSLNDALAEAVAIMQPQANRERVIIRSSFATRLPQIVADLRSVRQIALNILSNAVRYTQAGGQVIISTAYEPSGDIVMRVRDTGIGMTQAEIEQALKPFKQINALNRTRGDGTGLGLPLTKAMVEANRARFVITSAPSEGTLVEVVFPATRVLAQ